EAPAPAETAPVEPESVPIGQESVPVPGEPLPPPSVEEVTEEAASETENSVDRILAETNALLNSLAPSEPEAAGGQSSPAVSQYVGRHEPQKRGSSANSWYRPQDSEADSK
ncbi:MAG: hypothetical protein J6W44_06315, partial [Oscillospiraceae bacterium]|nr:hypothetical protein [Oscillospiraceae bacterium]